MYIKGSMEVQEYKFTVHCLYKREYGSTGVQVYSTICILKGVWKYRSTNLQYIMYFLGEYGSRGVQVDSALCIVKGGLKYRSYKFTVHRVY